MKCKAWQHYVVEITELEIDVAAPSGGIRTHVLEQVLIEYYIEDGVLEETVSARCYGRRCSPKGLAVGRGRLLKLDVDNMAELLDYLELPSDVREVVDNGVKNGNFDGKRVNRVAYVRDRGVSGDRPTDLHPPCQSEPAVDDRRESEPPVESAPEGQDSDSGVQGWDTFFSA